MRLAANHDNCSGCRTCQLVCALETFSENNPKKASIRIRGQFPAPGKYRITHCTQCGACFEICPVEAIKEHGEGYYYVDPDECIACMLCVEECPRDAMMTHPDHDAPFKCILCGSCIIVCPRNAVYDASDPQKTAHKEFDDEEVAG